MIDCVLQGVDIQLKMLQSPDPLSLVTDFPTIHIRPLGARKCTCFRSVLPLLFLDGWTGLLPRFRLSYMNL